MTGIGSSCGACKFLRRKCSSKCIFSPYFSYDVAVHHFAAVHKVFGASNASRLLQKIPEQYRNEAARALSYEALARMQDPVYGCIGHIYALQQQVVNLQEEIEILGNFLAVGTTSSAGSGAENDNVHGLHRTLQATTLNIPECMNYEEQQVSNYLLNQQSTLMIQPGNELDNQALRILDPSSSTFEGEIQYSTSCYRWLASGIQE
ncbi:hypothetical protein Droror1_Dr00002666 [Drosera rotundifolia]